MLRVRSARWAARSSCKSRAAGCGKDRAPCKSRPTSLPPREPARATRGRPPAGGDMHDRADGRDRCRPKHARANLRWTARASDSCTCMRGPGVAAGRKCTCTLRAHAARAPAGRVHVPADLAHRGKARVHFSAGMVRARRPVRAFPGGRRVRRTTARAEFRRQPFRLKSARPNRPGARLRPAVARLRELDQALPAMDARLAWLDPGVPTAPERYVLGRAVVRCVIRNP
jgi:hypothetical protein